MVISPAPTITPETASHVLWHVGQGGHQPGSFVASLLNTISCASRADRARLANAYPEYVAAVTTATSDADGVGALRCIEAGEPF